MMARILAFIVLAVCTLLPTLAQARGNDIRIGRMSPLRVEGAPELIRHEFSAVCGDLEDARCPIESRWTLPASDEPRAAVVYLLRAEGTKVTVDGEPVRFTIEADGRGWAGEGLSRVRVILPASDEPQVLGLSTELGLDDMGPKCGLGMAWPLGELRHISQHPVYVSIELDTELGDDTKDPPRVTFDGEIEYEVAAPRGWNIYGARGRRAKHGRRWRFSSAHPELTGTNRGVIHGPVVAAGARFPKRRDANLWLRGGWEVASFPSLAHSLVVESDIERVLIVPATEIGTPAMLFIPSLSVGVGVPIRVAPEFRPGARVTGGVNFPLVSVVGGYDHFPRYRGQAVERLGFIGLQFSI